MPGASVTIIGTVPHGVGAVLGTVHIHITIGGGSGPQGRARIIAGAEGNVHHGVAKAGALLAFGVWNDANQEQTGQTGIGQ